ncbi:undecaprenyldiphospho-muramoylpentapeptide beta-N-acetylglucosaminyltransferase [Halioxenophilus sp. WMMB6]|uniref:undecaprenyldiphospho-muramoylpentapeptide beta-N-acetylglucosaminyltransferase n=1 Tax=Halioxenophilus sp. WMMB6 TaxID=3073815 RepID=UPI00295F4576|nr:undecaprenyldiphospho-muramoylpentapeptide beta-N-acetylglucosaminyltransferase [Halioxenophilus sp. WMMB6]
MAGGTGGHIYPALAVAQVLIAKGAAVSWLGTRRGLEAQLVPAAGIELDFIDIEGVRGKGVLSLVKAPLLLMRAITQAKKVFKQRRAEVVVGFGGFVAGPGGVAAKLLGLPLLIHEQNAIAGTTNKLLAKIANRVFTAFPNVFAKAAVVGNPVRADISRLPAPDERWQSTDSDSSFHLLILGGSLGATALNELVPQALVQLNHQSNVKIEVLHQCGQKNIEQTQAAYKQAGVVYNAEGVAVQPYVEDMAAAYGWAHFIVCRAGALTIAEIAAAGCASLLVPYPHAIDDHQTHNALWLVGQGAAHLCQQRDLTVTKLVAELETAINDRAAILAMACSARALAKIDAAERVASECFEVLNSGQ